MYGGSYMWTHSRFRDAAREARERLDREQRARRAHRSLPRLTRLTKDFCEVADKLARASRRTPREVAAIGEAGFRRDTARWVKQYNRLARMLDTL
jgi:hypothetical protein